jgi:hypothetical protein
LAVADGVVLISAVAGVDVAVGADDLAEGIVAPCPAWDCWEGSAAGGDSGALADDVHGIVVTGDDAGANFVLLDVEQVAIRFVGVCDGVDGAGDSG